MIVKNPGSLFSFAVAVVAGGVVTCGGWGRDADLAGTSIVVVVVGGGINIVVVNAVPTCIVVVIVDEGSFEAAGGTTGATELEDEVDVDAVSTVTGTIDVVWKPVTMGVPSVAGAVGEALELVVARLEDTLVDDVVRELAAVVGVALARLEVGLIPNTLWATVLSVHPTKTPSVVFMGIATHCMPAGQTVVTKLPWSHFPTFPERQTIWSVVHGDEKFNVANKLLYPSASARFALKSAGEMVLVEGGTDDIIVGAAVTVSGITEEMDREEENIEDEVFGTWNELLEVVDADVMVLKSIVMIVVESPSDWNPAEATSDDGVVMDSVGRGIKLVLLSEKYGIAVVAAEHGVVTRGDWLIVDVRVVFKKDAALLAMLSII
jgi:hypothetical protein